MESRDYESTVELLEFLHRCSRMNHRVSGSSIPEIQVNLATPSEEELDSTIRQGQLRSPDRFGIFARHGLPERRRRVRIAIPHRVCRGVVGSKALISELRIASLRQNGTNHPAATRDCPFENARLRRSGALDCSATFPASTEDFNVSIGKCDPIH